MGLTRTIAAFNTATASDNKIHDDATAARFGFVGGLVPGVDVFAYLAHAPRALWGPDWLTQGAIRARFAKPVYDGDAATLTANETAEGLSLRLSARSVRRRRRRARGVGRGSCDCARSAARALYGTARGVARDAACRARAGLLA